MGCYRVSKHVYNDNWEDPSQFRTRRKILDPERLFNDPCIAAEEKSEGRAEEEENEESDN